MRQKIMQVYVIERPDGLVKIGKSGNPTRRINHLETQGGFRSSRVWMSLPGIFDARTETRAHRALDISRTVGEWFSVPFDDAVASVVGNDKPAIRTSVSKNVRRTVAENAIRLRKLRRMSQTEMGAMAGVGQTTISSLEDPDGASPTIETLSAVAQACGVPEWELMIDSPASQVLSILDQLSSSERQQCLRMLQAFTASLEANQ
jgi:transcriptional regulator with XRE-family HTH domain